MAAIGSNSSILSFAWNTPFDRLRLILHEFASHETLSVFKASSFRLSHVRCSSRLYFRDSQNAPLHCKIFVLVFLPFKHLQAAW